MAAGRRTDGAAPFPGLGDGAHPRQVFTRAASHFGRHCKLVDRLDDGRVRARVAAPTARGVAEQVAGWGATIEVVEPESVRSELARIGSELAQRYTT